MPLGRRTVSALVSALALAAVVTPAATTHAAPVTSVAVVPLAKDWFDACDERVRYVSGEIQTRTRTITNAAGGEVTRVAVRAMGAVAVGEDSGYVYRDRTILNAGDQGNRTWYETDFAEGSHGVHGVLRSRLSAPGTGAPTLTVSLLFHLRRVDGILADPPVDFEKPFTVSCR
jgi:hypothetical protein